MLHFKLWFVSIKSIRSQEGREGYSCLQSLCSDEHRTHSVVRGIRFCQSGAQKNLSGSESVHIWEGDRGLSSSDCSCHLCLCGFLSLVGSASVGNGSALTPPGHRYLTSCGEVTGSQPLQSRPFSQKVSLTSALIRGQSPVCYHYNCSVENQWAWK